MLADTIERLIYISQRDLSDCGWKGLYPMATKDRILREALTLFSERGYGAVRVGDIAAAVGIKAPSLYKHYKSKQAIFDACVEFFFARMGEASRDIGLPGTAGSEASYATVGTEEIVGFATRLFTFHVRDDAAARFRRMLMIERYRDPELNRRFEDLFIDGAIRHEEGIFQALMEEGVIRRQDPHLLALRFYTPIFYLLQKYDLRPDDIDQALAELTMVVEEFCDTYMRLDG